MGSITLSEAEKRNADFSGWATKAGLRCSDGRTIMPEAFKHMDGERVPLVWQHAHGEPTNILGHAILEHREGEGVYTYGFFNETTGGQNAKALVVHKDINHLSIFANRLVEKSKQVFHGMIREVSLVLSGANPGAVIENVAIAHSDGDTEILDDEAVIYTDYELEVDDDVTHADTKTSDVTHAEDDEDETVADVFDTLNEKQKNVVYFMIGQALEQAGGSAAQSDDLGPSIEHADDATVKDIFDAMTDVQKNVVYFMIGSALEDAGVEHSDDDENALAHQDQEGTTMTRNVFEQDDTKSGGPTLSHDDLQSIVENAKKPGQTLKSAFLAHAVEYGIENIDYLFPDARNITNTPELIARRQEWVNVVLSGVRKSPFSRIKSVSADLTLDQARAKGYVKGNLKKDEWFKLEKRTTTPTTIYKKQKLDRDDIVDITDLDVVAFLKGEMRLMLDEEIARAILFGDGREIDDEDKVDENCIRPIAHDDDFYTHRVVLPANVAGDVLVESILRARPKYRGSGRPTLFLVEELLTDMLLGKDKMGRRLYNSEADLMSALRVGAIQTVDAMEDQTTDGGDLLAVLVNLADYTVGADRGGNVAMFDDFDIDYNQYKYLIETRMSGALTRFKSAQAFVRSAGTQVVPTVPTFDTTTGVLTVPDEDGVMYYNADTDTLLTAGAQAPVAAGETVTVEARPESGYYFPHNTDADWDFTRNA
jgi:hypothetical protein